MGRGICKLSFWDDSLILQPKKKLGEKLELIVV